MQYAHDYRIHPGRVKSSGAMLAPIRLTWHLSVLATRLRRYRCAVSRDERHCAATLRVR